MVMGTCSQVLPISLFVLIVMSTIQPFGFPCQSGVEDDGSLPQDSFLLSRMAQLLQQFANVGE